MPTGIRNSGRSRSMTLQTDTIGDYLLLPNGQKKYFLTVAITANTTTTTAPAGSRAQTSHATGRMSEFVSDGTKWQYLTNA